MNDLISRRAAINEMKIRQHSAYEWYATAKSKDDEEIMVRADSALASFIECILTLKKLPSAQRWILCSKRLPEADGLYLVTTSKGQVQMHVFNHNGNSEEYWARCNIAWMPLPEPYRGESKE